MSLFFPILEMTNLVSVLILVAVILVTVVKMVVTNVVAVISI